MDDKKIIKTNELLRRCKEVLPHELLLEIYGFCNYDRRYLNIRKLKIQVIREIAEILELPVNADSVGEVVLRPRLSKIKKLCMKIDDEQDRARMIKGQFDKLTLGFPRNLLGVFQSWSCLESGRNFPIFVFQVTSANIMAYSKLVYYLFGKDTSAHITTCDEVTAIRWLLGDKSRCIVTENEGILRAMEAYTTPPGSVRIVRQRTRTPPRRR